MSKAPPKPKSKAALTKKPEAASGEETPERAKEASTGSAESKTNGHSDNIQDASKGVNNETEAGDTNQDKIETQTLTKNMKILSNLESC